ncbi:hypothetical protein E8F11_17480 [Pseudomonas sp. BN417]|uniref:hypothetical protein n=1 Tax=Pseudomonas sp. BN417 TaxID=2567890 RepID=UPI00245777F7|nr:hypothetical protein [Pseudomonas sp. BN417]MDH4556937.1 hypothetical protein [Pseudomonas sp. BN417]
MISAQDFSKRLLGYNVVDCEVRRRDFFYFIAREDYTQWTDWKEQGDYPSERSLYKRVLTFMSSKEPAKQWGHTTLKGFSRLTSGVSYSPKEQFIAGSLTGQIFALGSGDNEIQDEIGEKLRGTLERFATIDDELYVAGSGRMVGLRQGKNQWKWLSENVPYDMDSEVSTAGFDAIDGFSQEDIYAAGGKGDVWHYNGKIWRRVDFPSNVTIETMCCGADGRVYIGGYEGLTFVGRGDTWKPVKRREVIPLGFKDMVWYEDRVWCTNDNGVWWIINDEIVPADIPALAKVSSGNLSARDGVLLLAGFYGAAYLENGQWHQIFSYSEMVDRCKAEGLYDGILQARWHEFKD